MCVAVGRVVAVGSGLYVTVGAVVVVVVGCVVATVTVPCGFVCVPLPFGRGFFDVDVLVSVGVVVAVIVASGVTTVGGGSTCWVVVAVTVVFDAFAESRFPAMNAITPHVPSPRPTSATSAAKMNTPLPPPPLVCADVTYGADVTFIGCCML